MNASSTTKTMTPCPEWCERHWPAEEPGSLGAHRGTITTTSGAKAESVLWFEHDGRVDRRNVYVIEADDGMTPAQARELASALLEASDRIAPMDAITRQALTEMCDAMYTTLADVATEAGVQLDTASQLDALRLSTTLGDRLVAARTGADQ